MADPENPRVGDELPITLDKSIVLSSQQQILYEVLVEFDNPMARIYLGAIFVFSDLQNPDRFALAAHNLRELLSRLPKRLGIGTAPFQEKFDNRILILRQQWEKLRRNSNCWQDNSWNGEIDPTLQNFLARLPEFFDWYDLIKPRRKDVVTSTLRGLDPGPINLPLHVEEEQWQEWQSLYTFFTALAHHEKPADAEEFSLQLGRLEEYLLTRLRPHTFEDFTDIDNLIKQAEGHD